MIAELPAPAAAAPESFQRQNPFLSFFPLSRSSSSRIIIINNPSDKSRSSRGSRIVERYKFLWFTRSTFFLNFAHIEQRIFPVKGVTHISCCCYGCFGCITVNRIQKQNRECDDDRWARGSGGGKSVQNVTTTTTTTSTIDWNFHANVFAVLSSQDFYFHQSTHFSDALQILLTQL